MKKVYGYDYNNILTEVFSKLDRCDDPREADSFLLWQDVRGGCLTLCEINKDYMNKPVTVVQHGRGAMRDYLPPNNFKMNADRICVWGESELEYLSKAGFSDRAVITGSPLKSYLKQPKPKSMHEGSNVVFVPIISDQEVPENVEWFYQLKKIELDFCIERLKRQRSQLKEKGWHSWNLQPGCVTDQTIPWDVMSSQFRVIAKLAGVHDRKLYHGNSMVTIQQNKFHLMETIKLLQYASVVVAVEEGTLPLLAMAMDIPVVMIEGFKYGTYGGIEYDGIEIIKTDAATWVNPDSHELREAIVDAIDNPSRLSNERKKVVDREFCPSTISDPVTEIVKVISNVN